MNKVLQHKVLVLDDDPDILQFIELEFSKHSLELVLCSSVDEAIHALGENLFTLAIIDIVMGDGKSSEQFLKFIKEDLAGKNKNLPMAIMSAHMNDEYGKKLRLKGSNVYCTLKKPLQLNELSNELLGLTDKSVLIVEEDSDIVSLIKKQLEYGDYQVLSCASCELAIRTMNLLSIDFLIIGNRLGVESDTSEFVEHVKEYYSDTPCILTGKDVETEYLWQEKLNIQGILAKPIDKEDILSSVDKYFVQGEQPGPSKEIAQVIKGSKESVPESRVIKDNESSKKEEDITISGDDFEDLNEARSFIKGDGSANRKDELVKIKGSGNLKEEALGLSNRSINQRNKNGQTPLMIFCYLGEMDKVKELIVSGADKKAKSLKGKTCLHYAAYSGNVELLKYLISEHGLKVNERDNEGHTPLYDAIKVGELESVKACVENGARLSYYKEGKSYLTYAVLSGNVELVKYFKGLGLPSDKKDYKGFGPIDYALRKKNREIISILKE